jgi:hypothetical protein
MTTKEKINIEKIIEALLLLRSYYERSIKGNVSYALYLYGNDLECPLCDAMCDIYGYINCKQCPWAVMTGLPCCELSDGPSKNLFTRISNDPDVKQARINEIDEWIEFYSNLTN